MLFLILGSPAGKPAAPLFNGAVRENPTEGRYYRSSSANLSPSSKGLAEKKAVHFARPLGSPAGKPAAPFCVGKTFLKRANLANQVLFEELSGSY